MKELNDRQLDAMMREAAGNYTPNYNPEAWAQMQATLKAEGLLVGSKSSVHPLFKYLPIALLIILSIVGLYYFVIKPQSQPAELQTISGINSTESTQISPDENDCITSDQNEAVSTAGVSNITGQENCDEIVLLKDNAQSGNALSSTEYMTPHTIHDITGSVEDIDQIDQIPPINEGKANMNSGIFRIDSLGTEGGDFIVLNMHRMQPLRPDENHMKNAEGFPLTFEMKESIVSVIDQPKQHKFAISLLVSPDFSGASITKMKGTGIDIGLMAEYFIGANFSINSGVIYSTKKYLVDDGFEGYSQRWPDRDEPLEIDAACSVIDVPINLKYYFRNSGRTRFFVNTGITSYFMLNEDYTYIYYDAADWSVRIENENKHYFGLLNFSFGIQKELSEGLYLIAEPYYKSPLTGIGAGQVSLKSSGFLISIKKDF